MLFGLFKKSIQPACVAALLQENNDFVDRMKNEWHKTHREKESSK